MPIPLPILHKSVSKIASVFIIQRAIDFGHFSCLVFVGALWRHSAPQSPRHAEAVLLGNGCCPMAQCELPQSAIYTYLSYFIPWLIDNPTDQQIGGTCSPVQNRYTGPLLICRKLIWVPVDCPFRAAQVWPRDLWHGGWWMMAPDYDTWGWPQAGTPSGKWSLPARGPCRAWRTSVVWKIYSMENNYSTRFRFFPNESCRFASKFSFVQLAKLGWKQLETYWNLFRN